MLYADGPPTSNDIDCRFGPHTEIATIGDPEIFRYDGTHDDEYFLRVTSRYGLFPGHLASCRPISSEC